MRSCEQSEGGPISSILLPLIGRDGVIGLVLERVVPVFARSLLVLRRYVCGLGFRV